MLRGVAVDEAGKVVAGAKFTTSFVTESRSGAMSLLEATTDAQGKFELRDVLLPLTMFQPESGVQMVAIKTGFDGAKSDVLKLLDVKKAGSGDFGTVVLRPGHTLRGKVVDEKGRTVQGAVVLNISDYFFYHHLTCRTDAQGQFAMPDLRKGPQKIWARYGERFGQADLDTEAASEEQIIHLRLPPKRAVPGLPAAR